MVFTILYFNLYKISLILPINRTVALGQYRLTSGYHLEIVFSNEIRLSTAKQSRKQSVCNIKVIYIIHVQ